MRIGSGNGADCIETEAAFWAAKIDASPQASTSPELVDWLQNNPKHVGALLRAQAALALFGAALPQQQVFHSKPDDTRSDAQPAPRKMLWGRGLVAGVGAGAAIAAAVVWISLYNFSPHIPIQPAQPKQQTAIATPHHAISRPDRIRAAAPPRMFNTEIGESRSLALDDNSVVVLDARSKMTVRIDQNRRNIHLIHGKALFRVAHDSARPFQVNIGDVRVTDVGTVFQITENQATSDVEVLVTEGEVQVVSPAGQTHLSAGMRARFPLRGTSSARALAHTVNVETVPAAAINRALARRDGHLDLDGEQLREAVAEMNRHNRLQIRLSDAALGKEKLFGSFRIDDPSGFANAAAASIGAETINQSGGVEIIRSRK